MIWQDEQLFHVSLDQSNLVKDYLDLVWCLYSIVKSISQNLCIYNIILTFVTCLHFCFFRGGRRLPDNLEIFLVCFTFGFDFFFTHIGLGLLLEHLSFMDTNGNDFCKACPQVYNIICDTHALPRRYIHLFGNWFNII